MIKLFQKTLLIILISLFPLNAMATNVTVEMLNKMGKESMVYSKKIVNVNVGDTVLWKATTTGHNVEFIKGSSEESLKKLDFHPDIVILDPPRSGCKKDVLDSLILIKPKKILMISCDLDSFMRDTEILCMKNYKLKLIQPVDMFPNTKHIEILAILEKIN